MNTIETLTEVVSCLDPHDHHEVINRVTALIEQMEQADSEPVGEIIEACHTIGFGRKEYGKTVQFDMTLPVGTKLYTHAPNSAAEIAALKAEVSKQTKRAKSYRDNAIAYIKLYIDTL